MPEELQFFCDQHPELVGEVETLSNAREYEPVDLAQRIQGHTVFVLSSTFIYKDQLERMLEAFDVGLFGPGPFTFYVELLRIHLEDWTQKTKDGQDYSYSARMNFSNHDVFIERLIRMEQEERLVLYDVIVSSHTVNAETGRKLGWKEYDDHPNREMVPCDSEAIRVRYNPTTKEFERQSLSKDEQDITEAGPLTAPK